MHADVKKLIEADFGHFYLLLDIEACMYENPFVYDKSYLVKQSLDPLILSILENLLIHELII